jgi:hypothetical protein
MRDNKPSGICLISVPKSGTMFMSRYLEKFTGISAEFGLQPKTQLELLKELRDGWNPDVQAALHSGSPDIRAMTRRFSRFLARQRHDENASSKDTVILSDHGLHSFLRFLVKPSTEEICAPEEIIQWAVQRNLVVVYLYRDIRQIANSLAHFLVGGKSWLLQLQSLSMATELVCKLYAPVLANQMKLWRAYADDDRVITIHYEDLVRDPGAWINKVCRASGLPFRPEDIIQQAGQYLSWTYRHAHQRSWKETFSDQQLADLCLL